MSRGSITSFASLLLIVPLAAAFASNPDPPTLEATNPVLQIPRITGAPKLTDFEGFSPATPLAKSMVKVNEFITREPVFGKAPTQPTEVYLGYTEQNLYMMFVAHDTDPRHLRSHMSRREDVDDD